MKKKSLLLIVLIYFSINSYAFSEFQHSFSFITGTGTDYSYSDKNTLSFDWIYDYSSDFLKLDSGCQLTNSSVDFSVNGNVFKTFFQDSFFSPEISGGLILHSCFLNTEAFLQDSFLTGSLNLSINPINTKLGILFGAGFDNTCIYAKPKNFWINEFYPIMSVSISTRIKSMVDLKFKFSTFSMFNYDFWAWKPSMYADVFISKRIKVLGIIIFYYTPDAANDNIQLNGFTYKMGIKYAF